MDMFKMLTCAYRKIIKAFHAVEISRRKIDLYRKGHVADGVYRRQKYVLYG